MYPNQQMYPNNYTYETLQQNNAGHPGHVMWQPGHHTAPGTSQQQSVPGQHTAPRTSHQQSVPGQHIAPGAQLQSVPGQHTAPGAQQQQSIPGHQHMAGPWMQQTNPDMQQQLQPGATNHLMGQGFGPPNKQIIPTCPSQSMNTDPLNQLHSKVPSNQPLGPGFANRHLGSASQIMAPGFTNHSFNQATCYQQVNQGLTSPQMTPRNILSSQMDPLSNLTYKPNQMLSAQGTQMNTGQISPGANLGNLMITDPASSQALMSVIDELEQMLETPLSNLNPASSSNPISHASLGQAIQTSPMQMMPHMQQGAQFSMTQGSQMNRLPPPQYIKQERLKIPQPQYRHLHSSLSAPISQLQRAPPPQYHGNERQMRHQMHAGMSAFQPPTNNIARSLGSPGYTQTRPNPVFQAPSRLLQHSKLPQPFIRPQGAQQMQYRPSIQQPHISSLRQPIQPSTSQQWPGNMMLSSSSSSDSVPVNAIVIEPRDMATPAPQVGSAKTSTGVLLFPGTNQSHLSVSSSMQQNKSMPSTNLTSLPFNSGTHTHSSMRAPPPNVLQKNAAGFMKRRPKLPPQLVVIDDDDDDDDNDHVSIPTYSTAEQRGQLLSQPNVKLPASSSHSVSAANVGSQSTLARTLTNNIPDGITSLTEGTRMDNATPVSAFTGNITDGGTSMGSGNVHANNRPMVQALTWNIPCSTQSPAANVSPGSSRPTLTTQETNMPKSASEILESLTIVIEKNMEDSMNKNNVFAEITGIVNRLKHVQDVDSVPTGNGQDKIEKSTNSDQSRVEKEKKSAEKIKIVPKKSQDMKEHKPSGSQDNVTFQLRGIAQDFKKLLEKGTFESAMHTFKELCERQVKHVLELTIAEASQQANPYQDVKQQSFSNVLRKLMQEVQKLKDQNTEVCNNYIDLRNKLNEVNDSENKYQISKEIKMLQTQEMEWTFCRLQKLVQVNDMLSDRQARRQSDIDKHRNQVKDLIQKAHSSDQVQHLQQELENLQLKEQVHIKEQEVLGSVKKTMDQVTHKCQELLRCEKEREQQADPKKPASNQQEYNLSTKVTTQSNQGIK